MGARVFGAMAAVGKSSLAGIGDVTAGTCTHTGGPAEGADGGAGSGHIAIAIATAKSSNKLAVVPVNVAANANPPDVAPLVGKDAPDTCSRPATRFSAAMPDPEYLARVSLFASRAVPILHAVRSTQYPGQARRVHLAGMAGRYAGIRSPSAGFAGQHLPTAPHAAWCKMPRPIRLYVRRDAAPLAWFLQRDPANTPVSPSDTG